MKVIMITTLVLMLGFPLLLSAQNADRILGTWFNGERSSKIEIVKTNSGAYQGRIVWLAEPNDDAGNPKVDVRNPNREHRSRPLMRLVILTGLQFKEGNRFDSGRIYDPKSGNTYSCKAELRNNNTLALRGFMGVSLIGRTDVWTRAQ